MNRNQTGKTGGKGIPGIDTAWTKAHSPDDARCTGEIYRMANICSFLAI